MTKEESDKKYLDELSKLYAMAFEKKEIANAAFLLEKVRNMELYQIRPAKDDTTV